MGRSIEEARRERGGRTLPRRGAGRRTQPLDEVPVDVEVHVHVAPPVAGPLDHPEGQVVEELVGEHDPGLDPFRELGERGHAVGMLRSQRLGTLDEDQLERIAAGRPGSQDRSGEGPTSSAGLHDLEPGRPIELLPPRIERPGEHLPEEGPDLRRGDEVTPRTAGPTAAREEADLRGVEAELDEAVEAERSVLLDRPTDDLAGRAPCGCSSDGAAQPPAAATSVVAMSPNLAAVCGRTPTTRVAATVTVSAMVSDGVDDTGVSSPSGTSSNHIWRATAA